MLLIFDMFGTLVDIEPVNRKMHQFLTLYTGVDIDYDSFKKFYIEKYYEVFSDLEKKPYTIERYYFNVLYSQLLNYLGVNKSPDFVVGYAYGILSSLLPFEDIRCLSHLKSLEHTLWILSNSDSEYSIPLAYSLPIKFDGITTASMARCYKPCEKIYRVVLEESGFASEEAIMVGDSLSDVIGAEKVGIKGILIDRYGRYQDYKGNKISSLCDVKGVVSHVV